VSRLGLLRVALPPIALLIASLIIFPIALEPIPIKRIGKGSASFTLAHVLIGKPVPTFPGHAGQ